MLAAVAATLETLQPVRVPGFAFPWLELISHRRARLCLAEHATPATVPAAHCRLSPVSLPDHV